MNLVGLGVTLSLVLLAASSARAQDVAPVFSVTDSSSGPVIAIAAIDSGARATVERLLEIRGYDPEADTLDGALRAFAADHELEPPDRTGFVGARTLDELGAGHAVAVRWGRTDPRAPELSSEEIFRLNAALARRGYTGRDPRPFVDDETIAALRAFQRDTGHPVEEGQLVERRWLFILGVASDESAPRRELTLPASAPR